MKIHKWTTKFTATNSTDYDSEKSLYRWNVKHLADINSKIFQTLIWLEQHFNKSRNSPQLNNRYFHHRPRHTTPFRNTYISCHPLKHEPVTIPQTPTHNTQTVKALGTKQPRLAEKEKPADFPHTHTYGFARARARAVPIKARLIRAACAVSPAGARSAQRKSGFRHSRPRGLGFYALGETRSKCIIELRCADRDASSRNFHGLGARISITSERAGRARRTVIYAAHGSR